MCYKDKQSHIYFRNNHMCRSNSKRPSYSIQRTRQLGFRIYYANWSRKFFIKLPRGKFNMQGEELVSIFQ